VAGTTYPHIHVEGSPRERGRQYGEQARDRVALSVEAYAWAYEQTAGLSWEGALAVARPFEAAIARFEPRYLEEMRGLAEGSGQTFEAILALNVRTEIMLSAKARDAQESGAARRPGECTTIAALPAVTDTGHTVLAENWDWLPHTSDTLIVVEARQDTGPAYVTVVEAGLLAKVGMNASGVGVATNALISSADVGAVGVPYHLTLRGLLDAENLPAALASVQRRPRSSSANYMLAMAGGQAIDVEARPGDLTALTLLEPRDGLIVHANHFVGTIVATDDVGIWWMPDSPFRYMRVRELLRCRVGAVTVESLQRVLTDHANHPVGVCAHADLREAPMDQGQTSASLIMDLDERTLWLADGMPCTVGYRRLDYAGLLAPDPA
jgi:isopenicillin-N N-acyltransferase like protein